MKAIMIVILMIFMVSCGKKDAAPDESPASLGEPGAGEKSESKATREEIYSGMIANDDPRPEMSADAPPTEAPLPPSDAPPVARPEPGVVGGDKDLKKNEPAMDTVRPTTGSPTTGGGLVTMGSVKKDLDENSGEDAAEVETVAPPKKPRKMAPKPDPQASGYHGMDQDEPTQE